MHKTAMILGLTLAGTATAPALADASASHASAVRVEPIAGVYNKFWYNYLADIQEADKELKSDLRRATDAEDTRDAWEEYGQELADADKDYVKEMRERNYRVGRVSIGR